MSGLDYTRAPRLIGLETWEVADLPARAVDALEAWAEEVTRRPLADFFDPDKLHDLTGETADSYCPIYTSELVELVTSFVDFVDEGLAHLGETPARDPGQPLDQYLATLGGLGFTIHLGVLLSGVTARLQEDTAAALEVLGVAPAAAERVWVLAELLHAAGVGTSLVEVLEYSGRLESHSETLKVWAALGGAPLGSLDELLEAVTV